ncbi:hypothetical protein L2E82_45228 [Cichorium intybus]|uniref:Uncharacterized protein n=1 Tax=Cichorium intybus TaxID=13427 RepID=A0ACB8ZRZ2_CICIN|nr:hypothetical protein L2E82_45228 [Cichorium intybus]
MFTLSFQLCVSKRGLEVVSSLGGEFSSVRKAAPTDSSLHLEEVGILPMGLTNCGEEVTLNEQIGSNGSFSESMNVFLKKTKSDLVKIDDQEHWEMADGGPGCSDGGSVVGGRAGMLNGN